MKKLMRADSESSERTSGAVMLMMGLLLLPFVIFGLALIEVQKTAGALSAFDEAMGVSAISVLADYDDYLLDRWGLVAYRQSGSINLKNAKGMRNNVAFDTNDRIRDAFVNVLGDNTTTLNGLSGAKQTLDSKYVLAVGWQGTTLAEDSVMKAGMKEYAKQNLPLVMGRDYTSYYAEDQGQNRLKTDSVAGAFNDGMLQETVAGADKPYTKMVEKAKESTGEAIGVLEMAENLDKKSQRVKGSVDAYTDAINALSDAIQRYNETVKNYNSYSHLWTVMRDQRPYSKAIYDFAPEAAEYFTKQFATDGPKLKVACADKCNFVINKCGYSSGGGSDFKLLLENAGRALQEAYEKWRVPEEKKSNARQKLDDSKPPKPVAPSKPKEPTKPKQSDYATISEYNAAYAQYTIKYDAYVRSQEYQAYLIKYQQYQVDYNKWVEDYDAWLKRTDVQGWIKDFNDAQKELASSDVQKCKNLFTETSNSTVKAYREAMKIYCEYLALEERKNKWSDAWEFHQQTNISLHPITARENPKVQNIFEFKAQTVETYSSYLEETVKIWNGKDALGSGSWSTYDPDISDVTLAGTYYKRQGNTYGDVYIGPWSADYYTGESKASLAAYVGGEVDGSLTGIEKKLYPYVYNDTYYTGIKDAITKKHAAVNSNEMYQYYMTEVKQTANGAGGMSWYNNVVAAIVSNQTMSKTDYNWSGTNGVYAAAMRARWRLNCLTNDEYAKLRKVDKGANLSEEAMEQRSIIYTVGEYGPAYINAMQGTDFLSVPAGCDLTDAELVTEKGASFSLPSTLWKRYDRELWPYKSYTRNADGTTTVRDTGSDEGYVHKVIGDGNYNKFVERNDYWEYWDPEASDPALPPWENLGYMEKYVPDAGVSVPLELSFLQSYAHGMQRLMYHHGRLLEAYPYNKAEAKDVTDRSAAIASDALFDRPTDPSTDKIVGLEAWSNFFACQEAQSQDIGTTGENAKRKVEDVITWETETRYSGKTKCPGGKIYALNKDIKDMYGNPRDGENTNPYIADHTLIKVGTEAYNPHVYDLMCLVPPTATSPHQNILSAEVTYPNLANTATAGTPHEEAKDKATFNYKYYFDSMKSELFGSPTQTSRLNIANYATEMKETFGTKENAASYYLANRYLSGTINTYFYNKSRGSTFGDENPAEQSYGLSNVTGIETMRSKLKGDTPIKKLETLGSYYLDEKKTAKDMLVALKDALDGGFIEGIRVGMESLSDVYSKKVDYDPTTGSVKLEKERELWLGDHLSLAGYAAYSVPCRIDTSAEDGNTRFRTLSDMDINDALLPKATDTSTNSYKKPYPEKNVTKGTLDDALSAGTSAKVSRAKTKVEVDKSDPTFYGAELEYLLEGSLDEFENQYYTYLCMVQMGMLRSADALAGNSTARVNAEDITFAYPLYFYMSLLQLGMHDANWLACDYAVPLTRQPSDVAFRLHEGGVKSVTSLVDSRPLLVSPSADDLENLQTVSESAPINRSPSSGLGYRDHCMLALMALVSDTTLVNRFQNLVQTETMNYYAQKYYDKDPRELDEFKGGHNEKAFELAEAYTFVQAQAPLRIGLIMPLSELPDLSLSKDGYFGLNRVVYRGY